MAVLGCLILLACFCYIFKKILTNRDSTGHNRFHKTPVVVTTFILLLGFSIFWLPYIICDFALVVYSDRYATRMENATAIFLLREFFSSVTYSFPFFNSIVLGCRIRIVRQFIFENYCCCVRMFTSHNSEKDERGSSVTIGNLRRNTQGLIEDLSVIPVFTGRNSLMTQTSVSSNNPDMTVESRRLSLKGTIVPKKRSASVDQDDAASTRYQSVRNSRNFNPRRSVLNRHTSLMARRPSYNYPILGPIGPNSRQCLDLERRLSAKA